MQPKTADMRESVFYLIIVYHTRFPLWIIYTAILYFRRPVTRRKRFLSNFCHFPELLYKLLAQAFKLLTVKNPEVTKSLHISMHINTQNFAYWNVITALSN